MLLCWSAPAIKTSSSISFSITLRTSCCIRHSNNISVTRSRHCWRSGASMIRFLFRPERRPTAGIIPMPLSSFWTPGTSPWRRTSKRSQAKSVDSWTEQVSALKRKGVNNELSYKCIDQARSEAQRQGIAARVARLPMSAVLRAQTTDENQGFMKALIGDDDRVLGFTMIGSEAGEVIAAVQTAMLANLKYSTLRGAVLAHPTTA